MNDMETEVPVVDELTALKARADLLGVKYHPSISLEKLRDKVNAAIEADKEEEDNVSEAKAESAKRADLQKKANELVRIRVTCMNPAKKEWEGEIFTVGNAAVGTLKKYVPFNAEEGWHVPRMILEQMQERQCQIFTASKDMRGNNIRKAKLIKEFAIEILPPLTEEELKDLAQRQMMAKSV